MTDRALLTDVHAGQMKEHAGEKYRPSNGTEGAMFMERWCCQCVKDAAFQAGTGDSCPIAAASVCFEKDEEGYPTEWQYGDDGQPRCTAFEETSKSEGPE